MTTGAGKVSVIVYKIQDMHTGFCDRPIVLAFWLAVFTPRLDPILPEERYVNVISRAWGVEGHTYRFFTRGSVFQYLLVNSGFGDLRASFTNEHIPQPLESVRIRMGAHDSWQYLT